MAWNNNYAFKILADMPTKLSAKNLEFLQSEIDKDKLAASIEMNRDLCGAYAPFCAFCDKKIKYPCAVALVRYKQKDGLQLEIAAAEDESLSADTPAESENKELLGEITDVSNENTQNCEEKRVTEEKESDIPADGIKSANVEAAEEVKPQTVKKRIRIAIAKRKH